MPEIIFHNTGKSIEKIMLCDPCYDIVSNHREEELCDVCAKACDDAGMPMKPRVGVCARCMNRREVSSEFAAHPQFKFCEDCCPKGKLQEKQGLCVACGRWMNVKPAVVLGDRLFDACRTCIRTHTKP